jgi:hypothetical protein
VSTHPAELSSEREGAGAEASRSFHQCRLLRFLGLATRSRATGFLGLAWFLHGYRGLALNPDAEGEDPSPIVPLGEGPAGAVVRAASEPDVSEPDAKPV